MRSLPRYLRSSVVIDLFLVKEPGHKNGDIYFTLKGAQIIPLPQKYG